MHAPHRADLVDRIDAALPQTQCRRCGHAGCRPYAQAMIEGEAINRCPPGGEAVVAVLSTLTGRPRVALDATRGTPGPLLAARVDEARCIGCTLCREACPVDAIVGAAKRMHTVLADLCSGCALCLPPCPVDCIEMVSAGRAWTPQDARAARERFDARNRRLAAAATPASPSADEGTAEQADEAGEQRRQDIASALARARARRQGAGGKVSPS